MDRRPSRPYRGGSRRPGGGRGYGGGRSQGGGRGRRPPPPPMLLGEPSPALAQINAMNTAQLEAKILSLVNARTPLEKKLEQLQARDEPPAERIEKTKQLILRLMTLEKIARERLQGKLERKAQWEQSKR